jgi:hypothetical protein
LCSVGTIRQLALNRTKSRKGQKGEKAKAFPHHKVCRSLLQGGGCCKIHSTQNGRNRDSECNGLVSSTYDNASRIVQCEVGRLCAHGTCSLRRFSLCGRGRQ